MTDHTILGIDPGSRSTGFGVIKTQGSQFKFLTCGTITSKADDLATRLHDIHQGLSEIVQTYNPAQAAIEEVFFHQNAQSALKLGQARGVAILACAELAIPVAEYSARAIKQAIVGYGAAQKDQVQHMVAALLNLDSIPQNDAADGLAIAITHANNQNGLGELLKGRGRTRRRR